MAQIVVSPSVTFGLEDAAAQMAHTLTPTLARLIPTFDTNTLPTMSILVFAEGALIYPEDLYKINSREEHTSTRGDLHNSGLIHMAGFAQESLHGELSTRKALTQRLACSAHLIGLYPEQLPS